MNEEQLREQLKMIDSKLRDGTATLEEANRAIEIRAMLKRFDKARRWT